MQSNLAKALQEQSQKGRQMTVVHQAQVQSHRSYSSGMKQLQHRHAWKVQEMVGTCAIKRLQKRGRPRSEKQWSRLHCQLLGEHRCLHRIALAQRQRNKLFICSISH